MRMKHPVVFSILIIIAAFIVAGILAAVIGAGGGDSDASVSVARILVGLVLLIIFHKLVAWRCSLRGILCFLPLLLVVLFNIVYNVGMGASLISSGQVGMAVLIGFAPAIFEETLFRGLFLNSLLDAGERSGRLRPAGAVLISALVFALVHLTNAVGGGLATVLVQTVYAFAIGMVLGAAYRKTKDLISAILLHGLIDTSSYIFANRPETAPTGFLIFFIAVLAVLLVYAAFLLMRARRAAPAET